MYGLKMAVTVPNLFNKNGPASLAPSKVAPIFTTLTTDFQKHTIIQQTRLILKLTEGTFKQHTTGDEQPQLENISWKNGLVHFSIRLQAAKQTFYSRNVTPG